MQHTEIRENVSGTIEIRHNELGISVYIFINKNGKATIYESMEDLKAHVYFGEDVEHFKCNEDELLSIYEDYKYEELQVRLQINH